MLYCAFTWQASAADPNATRQARDLAAIAAAMPLPRVQLALRKRVRPLPVARDRRAVQAKAHRSSHRMSSRCKAGKAARMRSMRRFTGRRASGCERGPRSRASLRASRQARRPLETGWLVISSRSVQGADAGWRGLGYIHEIPCNVAVDSRWNGHGWHG